MKGEDVLSEDKPEMTQNIKKHITLESDSINRSNQILNNIWIRENEVLKQLITDLKNDEKRHHTALLKLSEKKFFRWDPNDFTVILHGTNYAEEKYKRTKEYKNKK